ncbi:MAG: cytidylyltransferase domain-containing protein, partial [Bradymonadaceae bacterium]
MSDSQLDPLAFIFARGGSKGVPRKNIRELAGKPLLGHAIEQALGSSYLEEVLLSTDDEEIAAVGREWGAEVPF